MRVDLSNGFSQIRSQGHLGSCTAFAAAAILEYIRNRSKGNYKNKKNFYSPRFIYYISRFFEECGTHTSHPRDTDCGSHGPVVAQVLMKYGACDEKVWDYNGCEREPPFPGYTDHFQNKFALKPSDECYAKAKQLFEFLDGYEIISDNMDEWVKQLANNQNPIYLSIEATDVFVSCINWLFYTQTGFGHAVGRHRVVIAGYDSKYPDLKTPGVTHEAFLIRNSWGDDWGINGSMWISKEALQALMPRDPIVFKPKKAFLPFPNPQPPAPIPVPPTPGPGPTPPPSPPPAPTPPTPTPPPTPYNPRTRKGDFAYQWWLFDSIKQFNTVNERGLGTHTLHTSGTGLNLDTDPRRLFIEWDTSNFMNKNPLITDLAYAGKVIGLGACRTAEITGDPAKADGKWKWTFKRIRKSAEPKAKVWLKEKGEHAEEKGSEITYTEPGWQTKNVDVNFFVKKTGAPVHITIELFKKRAADDRMPDTEHDTLQNPKDWNLEYSFANAERKIVKKERIELSTAITPILLSFKVPSDAEPAMYYILVRAYHGNKDLDYNFTNFQVSPKSTT